MADFTVLTMEANDKTMIAPNWVVVGPQTVAEEVRWSDQDDKKDEPSATWPAMIRPAGVSAVAYTYAFTADAVGNGFISNQGAVDCPAFTKGNYLFARWNWDNTGTFASGPIFTAYLTTGHAAITRQNPDGGLLQGSADTKPGASAFSYLKGEAYGQDDGTGAPAAEPGAAPAVTDGTVGVISPAAGAHWIGAFQDLMGDLDWILAPFTPTATSADTWSIMFALFTGPNMIPALYVPVLSLKYTWT